MMSEFVLTKPSSAYLAQMKAYREEFANCLDWLHGAQGLKRFEDPRNGFNTWHYAKMMQQFPKESTHILNSFMSARLTKK